MILADYGAEVIKVEQPEVGDGTRQWGPPWVGSESAYFLSVNRNKKSLTLDLKSQEGQDILKEFASKADILVENFRYGTTARMGIDYPTLSENNPGLIYCSISGYGQTGPYRERPGYDFMIQAQGGIMSVTGPDDGEPSKVGVAIVDITAGLYACTAILAALQERNTSGLGQFIDVSLLDSQVAWLANVAHNYFATGDTPLRYGNAHPNIVPYETFETEDGFLALAIGNDKQYRRFCKLVERPDLWEDERFQSNEGRVEHREELTSSLKSLLQQRTTYAWLELLIAADIPVARINDVPTILTDPQVKARRMVQQVEHSTVGRIKLLGPVPKLSRTPAQIYQAPPPLGWDTNELLSKRLGYSRTTIESLRNEGVI
jgi:formyl-CoA transferase